MRKKSNPTLKQIAELSGFSQASVSMILNQKSRAPFSHETIKLVLDAAEKLGYSKALSIKQIGFLSGKNIIVVLCPNISNPYYSTLAQAIEQAAFQKNFQIITLNTYRSPEIEKRNLEMLLDSQIAGIILCMPTQVPEVLGKVSKRIPVVLIGDKGSELNIDTVEMDNYGAGKLIAKHLIALGHKHIAYISTTLDAANNMRLNRLKGIQDAFAAECPDSSIRVLSRKISPNEELNDLFIEHHLGYEFAKEGIKDKKISAFVAVNDMVAYGVIDAVTTEKFHIPGDYSVCGFDNIFPSRLLPISLTTVDNFIVEKGHNAFSIIYSRIEGNASTQLAPPHTITRVEYSPRLVVRGSTSLANLTR